MNNINDKASDSVHIEDSASENIIKDVTPKQRMGDVKLLQGNGETVLVPTPSPDPNGKSRPTFRCSPPTCAVIAQLPTTLAREWPPPPPRDDQHSQ
jgi:hypothetical protein